MDTISDNPSGGPTGSTYFIMENAALKAENKRLRERCEAYKGQVKAGAEEIEKWKRGHKALCDQTLEDGREIERLRAALEKISDEENWGDDGGWDGESYPDEIARAALANGPTGRD